MPDQQILEDADDPYRAIRLGESPTHGGATRWGHLLTRFMRIVAVFWLAQGLMQWRFILGAEVSIFDGLPQAAAFAIVFFAVLDIVAGVGLWLATPWGGVLWLLIASAQIFVTFSIPGIFAGGFWLVGVDLLLVGLYFVLTYEASRDLDAPRLRRRKYDASLAAPPRSTLLRQALEFLGPQRKT